MAGVRGIRNPFPSKGGTAKGMFGNKGPKTGSGPNKDTLTYAHRTGYNKCNGQGGNKLPADSGSNRHQKPRSKSVSGAIGTSTGAPL